MYQRNGDGGAFLVILGIVVSHLDELKEEQSLNAIFENYKF